jgi:hypothetical protein
MSFEYELSGPDPSTCEALMDFARLSGAVPENIADVEVARFTRNQATISRYQSGLLLSVEALADLRRDPVFSLLTKARALGFVVFEEGDDEPLPWAEVIGS